jgi:hypothetical protein
MQSSPTLTFIFFWVVIRRPGVLETDVSGLIVRPILSLNPKDGTNSRYRNVGF